MTLKTFLKFCLGGRVSSYPAPHPPYANHCPYQVVDFFISSACQLCFDGFMSGRYFNLHTSNTHSMYSLQLLSPSLFFSISIYIYNIHPFFLSLNYLFNISLFLPLSFSFSLSFVLSVSFFCFRSLYLMLRKKLLIVIQILAMTIFF